MNPIAEDILMHFGRAKADGAPGVGTGNYDHGGDNSEAYQHTQTFVSRVTILKKEGVPEKDIAAQMGYSSTTELRRAYSRALSDLRAPTVERAMALRADGKGYTEIGRILGMNESSVRSLLDAGAAKRMTKARTTADILKTLVDERGMIDVGTGAELSLDCSKEKLNQALDILKEEGYEVYGGRMQQATNKGQFTTMRVLCPPGTEHRDIYDFDKVSQVDDYRVREKIDGEKVVTKAFEYPTSLDSKRLQITYAEDHADGHITEDGLVEIRRGVKDLDLKGSHYAQVRIMVDGKYYIKGMAVYSDDLPDGVDVRFNTNKHKAGGMEGALKEIKSDPTNPFGSTIKEKGGQYWYEDDKGEMKLGLINKKSDEGDWDEWGNTLPSQFLSKQSQKLIDQQLKISLDDKRAEYDDICSLTNPAVKRQFLMDFADGCDADAASLSAAALPRQRYQVILPLTDISDKEIYAPNFRDGETVALVRFPHGGTFEIPILKVNNKVQQGKDRITPEAKDAVGINFKTAEKLSGADFDGDTVMVIPCNEAGKPKIVARESLEGLKDFDSKSYGADEVRIGADGEKRYFRGGVEYKTMKKSLVQKEMGVVSNLITDMTLKGAPTEDIEKAVRHSMVVIDAYKHHLDYKASERDNDIARLKRKWQGHIGQDGRYHEGASTLISQAGKDVDIPKRKGAMRIDPETGKPWYKEANETYIDKKGKTQTRMQKVSLMSTIDDAHILSSGSPQEEAYADYANSLKAMANTARKEHMSTGRALYSSSAKTTYGTEVEELKSELLISKKNAPRERQAQALAGAKIKAQKESNPGMAKDEEKKLRQRCLTEARAIVGASRHKIYITDKQWEAVQAGAVSDSFFTEVMRYADKDRLRSLATPKSSAGLSTAKQARIRSLKANGYTQQQIADALGVSVTTVKKYQ